MGAFAIKLVCRLGNGDAIKVITGNDQLKVFIGVVLCYNLVVQLAEIAALFIFPVISRFLSKKQVFAIASFSPAIGLIGLIVSGFFIPQNAIVIGACGILYKLGTRNESIIASFQTLLVKTASAVSAWLIGTSGNKGVRRRLCLYPAMLRLFPSAVIHHWIPSKYFYRRMPRRPPLH